MNKYKQGKTLGLTSNLLTDEAQIKENRIRNWRLGRLTEMAGDYSTKKSLHFKLEEEERSCIVQMFLSFSF